jgi:hypothetical protein
MEMKYHDTAGQLDMARADLEEALRKNQALERKLQATLLNQVNRRIYHLSTVCHDTHAVQLTIFCRSILPNYKGKSKSKVCRNGFWTWALTLSQDGNFPPREVFSVCQTCGSQRGLS